MQYRNKALAAVLFIILFVFPFLLIINNAREDKLVKSTDSISKNEMASHKVSPMPVVSEDSMPSQDLIIGNPDAKVTLVEYGDFQCPFCGQFFRQTEPEIKKAYIDTGKVKIIFRVETHIGQESVRAGEAAYCANDQKQFPAYHDVLFRNQNGENDGAFSDANLKQFAVDIGLNVTSFNDCLDTEKYSSVVNASNTEAKNRGVTTTPTIFINDSKIVGAQPFAIYKRLIDEQL